MQRTVISLLAVVTMVGVVAAGVSMVLPSLAPHVAAVGAVSDVPARIQHQGVVAVSGVRFTGTGQFKFAIRDPDTGTSVWSNSADTSPADGVPDSAIAITVTDGVYSTRLGDASITNMDALPSNLFTDGNLQLRIWFNDGVNGWQLLSPDQELTSTPYAFMVADGSVATAKLADDAVNASKILNSAVTSAKIEDGAIADADVSSSAAISWSKVNKTGAVPADVGAQAANADLDDLADGSLSGAKVGSGIDAGNITTGSLSVSRISDGSITANKLASGVAIPPGAMMAYAGATAPTGWLLCDGSAVSRTTYADLFAAIGTAYGSGDGSTTFNVPDMRGRAPIGVGTGTGNGASGNGKPTGGSGLTARSRADWGGAERHTLSIAEMPSHNHGTASGDGNAAGGSSFKAALAMNAGCNNTTCSTGYSGGGGSHNNLQPYMAANFIIKQ